MPEAQVKGQGSRAVGIVSRRSVSGCSGSGCTQRALSNHASTPPKGHVMGITKWAAIAVTSLMGLANIGLIASSHLSLKILGPVLAVAAVISVFGLLTKRPWGTRSVIAVGVANL